MGGSTNIGIIIIGKSAFFSTISITTAFDAICGGSAESLNEARRWIVDAASEGFHKIEPLFAMPSLIITHGPLGLAMLYSRVIFSLPIPPVADHSIFWGVPAIHFSPSAGVRNRIEGWFCGGGVVVGVAVGVGVGLAVGVGVGVGVGLFVGFGVGLGVAVGVGVGAVVGVGVGVGLNVPTAIEGAG